VKLSLLTDGLGNNLEFVLDTAHKLGYEAIEVATGNWCASPVIDLDELLESKVSRERFLDALKSRNLEICALNCSGNQLAPGELGKKHEAVVEKTFRLAELISVDKIVMMSGLPGGGPDDKHSNWVVSSWPQETWEILEYQWSVAVKYWEKAVKRAENCGVKRIALENHGFQLVYNTETLLKLRNMVGTVVGMNVDPSHMFWMGGDPILMLRALGDAVYHIHAKDVLIEHNISGINGLLDTKIIKKNSERSWNYTALGFGHDICWWKEFFIVAKMIGYDGAVSLEMEDVSMDPLMVVTKSTQVLKMALPKVF
jgi:sugar phosphate isomerase/epimerase